MSPLNIVSIQFISFVCLNRAMQRSRRYWPHWFFNETKEYTILFQSMTTVAIIDIVHRSYFEFHWDKVLLNCFFLRNIMVRLAFCDATRLITNMLGEYFNGSVHYLRHWRLYTWTGANEARFWVSHTWKGTIASECSDNEKISSIDIDIDEGSINKESLLHCRCVPVPLALAAFRFPH